MSGVDTAGTVRVHIARSHAARVNAASGFGRAVLSACAGLCLIQVSCLQLDSWSVILNGSVEVTYPDSRTEVLCMGNSFGVSPTMEKEYMKGVMKTKVDDCQVREGLCASAWKLSRSCICPLDARFALNISLLLSVRITALLGEGVPMSNQLQLSLPIRY